MPIYEYRCQACGHRFTRFFRFWREAEETTVHCPTCHADQVRRLISRVAVHSGQPSSTDAEPMTEADTRPPVFGRKELNEIMRQREQWQAEVEAGE